MEAILNDINNTNINIDNIINIKKKDIMRDPKKNESLFRYILTARFIPYIEITNNDNSTMRIEYKKTICRDDDFNAIKKVAKTRNILDIAQRS